MVFTSHRNYNAIPLSASPFWPTKSLRPNLSWKIIAYSAAGRSMILPARFTFCVQSTNLSPTWFGLISCSAPSAAIRWSPSLDFSRLFLRA